MLVTTCISGNGRDNWVGLKMCGLKGSLNLRDM